VRWSKRGLVIEAPVPCKWASSHAAIPVADPRADGRLRIYFSARDGSGRAQIGSVDLDLQDPQRTAVFSAQPRIGLGPLGAYDDSGVTSACLVNHGGRQYQYYSGWSLGVSVPFYFYVGCAVSDDLGETWEKVSQAPVLGRDPVDPFLTASPWILIEDGLWRMWYVSGTGWDVVAGEARHRYHIKYAESRDGIDWSRDGTVCIDYAGESEYAIARPCVVKDGDRYRMWYCSRGDAYRIGYAESRNGVDWQRLDEQVGIDVFPGSWDAEMLAYPCVFDLEGTRWLLYNGDGYGRTGVGAAVLVRE
jgi:hypothetical protein